jgi:hypothetical protein
MEVIVSVWSTETRFFAMEKGSEILIPNELL